jgi:pimeloyl-ACP methyl ester carboxylesterase
MSYSPDSLPPPHGFTHAGRRIAYRTYGDGDRVVILIHGLLMDSRMYARLAPRVAAEGHRVIAVDMLGHGASDQPHDMMCYSMPQFGADVIALLDELDVRQAVIAGTSLGANVALEVAVAAPGRVRALVLEMPVLEHALAVAAAFFVPLALALRISRRSMRLVAAAARAIPRSRYLADLLLDFVRRDPAASLAVLDGLTFGRVAPPHEDRQRIAHPALVIGHPSDPLHPFSDADRTAAELHGARLVEAHSILEWRLRPERLDRELCRFLAEVWLPAGVGPDMRHGLHMRENERR